MALDSVLFEAHDLVRAEDWLRALLMWRRGAAESGYIIEAARRDGIPLRDIKAAFESLNLHVRELPAGDWPVNGRYWDISLPPDERAR